MTRPLPWAGELCPGRSERCAVSSRPTPAVGGGGPCAGGEAEPARVRHQAPPSRPGVPVR